MNDPLTIDPNLWFAVICEEFRTDDRGRISLGRVVNHFTMAKPPPDSGIPRHAHIRGALVVGVTEGFGDFSAEVFLVDLDERRLWERQENWTFSLAPGTAAGAVLVEQIDLWLTEPGKYRFVVRLRPGLEWPVRFEVAEEPPQARPQSQEPQE